MAELENLLEGLLDNPDIKNKLSSLVFGEKKQDSGEDAELMLKMTKALGSLKKGKDDPRSRLLCDLKPYISPARRKKVDEACNILRIMSVLDLLKDEL